MGEMLLALDTGVKLDIARRSQGPIYTVASGMSRYIGLCFPTDNFHRQENRLKNRATVSRPVEASRLYLPHLRYACRILCIDSSRYSASLHAADKGAGRAQYKSSVARNMIPLQNLMREAEFGRFHFHFPAPCFFCFAFLFCTIGRLGDSNGRNWGAIR